MASSQDNTDEKKQVDPSSLSPCDVCDKPLGYLLSAAVRNIRLVLNKRLAPFKITPPQYGVLMMLHQGKQGRLNEMAEQVDTDGPTICRILDRLERQTLLSREKDKDDRRCLVMNLTEQGKRLAKGCESIGETLDNELLEGLNPEEKQTLYNLLNRVLLNTQTILKQEKK